MFVLNWSLKDIESFTPVDFARFLFDNTAANGVLHMPKRFGSIKERDDDFDEFIMCWKSNDLDFLISKFNTLYDNLSKIANVYDKLSENETSVKNVLIDPELFDTWRVYVRRLEIGDFDRKTLDPVLEKELYKSELTKEESDLLDKYYKTLLKECVERVGGNSFAYDVVNHAWRLCRLISLKAPQIIVQNEARYLIGCMALHDYSDCD